MLLSLLSLPVLVAGLPSLQPRQDNVHHVPLSRRTFLRRGDFVDMDRVARSMSSLGYKYGFKSVDGLRRRASKSTFNTLDQGPDMLYLASINVGTPAQSLDVQLDTGSSNLWFATTACVSGCPSGIPEFNTSQSSTLQNSSQSSLLTFGIGNVTGDLLYDTVTFGSYTIPDQAFIGATQATDGVVLGSKSGLLGLAFKEMAVSGTTPFWQALINAGKLSSPEMSFYLTRFLGVVTDPTSTETHPGGTFTLGGTNGSFYKGDIEFQPFPKGVQPSFWLQTVTGFTVNGKSIDIGNSTDNLAAIDTGTQYIVAPATAAQAFWSQIDGSQKLSGNDTGAWQFPCTTNITSTLAFGGRAWPISAKDMNLGPNPTAEGFCIGAVFDAQALGQDLPGLPQWIVGDTFLKNVYSVFRAGDSPAVGFAELADGFND